jgi:hypothetical protein
MEAGSISGALTAVAEAPGEASFDTGVNSGARRNRWSELLGAPAIAAVAVIANTRANPIFRTMVLASLNLKTDPGAKRIREAWQPAIAFLQYKSNKPMLYGVTLTS